MEVFDKVMAGPDAAGLDPDRFSKRPGDVSCGKADPEDVRAFERALAGGDKEAPKKAAPAPREEKHGPQGGAEFSRAQTASLERSERPEGKPAPGPEVPEDRAARNPARDSASNIQKSDQALGQEAGQKVDQNIAPKADQNVDLKLDPRLDPKSAPKAGEAGEMPRAKLQEEPRRGSAKALNEEAFLAAMFGRGAQGPSVLAMNAQEVPPAVAGAAGIGAPKELGEAELSRLVDRILVGSPERGSEVRLVLNDRVLPGTEIRLARDAAGALQVTIETRDDAAFQTLVGARNDLERALQAAEKGSVSLDMRREGEDEGEAGDMRRRSRGLDEMADPR